MGVGLGTIPGGHIHTKIPSPSLVLADSPGSLWWHRGLCALGQKTLLNTKT